MGTRSERERRVEKVGKRKKKLVSHNEKGTEHLGGGDCKCTHKSAVQNTRGPTFPHPQPTKGQEHEDARPHSPC